MQKESLLFLFISECQVSSAKPELRKEQNKYLFFLPRRSNFGILNARVTEKRVKCKNYSLKLFLSKSIFRQFLEEIVLQNNA